MDRENFFRYLECENLPINRYNTLHSESKITVMVSLEEDNNITLRIKDNIHEKIVCIENMSIVDFQYLYFCFKLLTTERHANEYVESRNKLSVKILAFLIIWSICGFMRASSPKMLTFDVFTSPESEPK